MRIILFLYLLRVVFCFDFINHENDIHVFNKKLISENQRGRLFNKSINRNEKFQGKYLGFIKTNSKTKYHIVAFTYFFNLRNSPTAENHIFIYDEKYNYVGNYYVTLISELPKYILADTLYFKLENCKNYIKIDLSNGIKKTINLKCENSDNYYDLQKPG